MTAKNPYYDRVAPNVKFLIDDIEQPWVYSKPFDFIHARSLALSIRNYKKLIKQAYELSHPKPTLPTPQPLPLPHSPFFLSFFLCQSSLTDLDSNTVPGGWVEVQDWDARLRSDDGSTKGTSIEQCFDVILRGFEKAGIETCPEPYLKDWFREIGFEDIHEKRFVVSMGSWPKDKHLVRVLSFLSKEMLKN